jgi:1-acyl-sn-glycerol-3-phosphate acyltransferase
MLYDLAHLLVRVICRIFFRVEVEGRENIPEGGCLVVCNHLSWTDTAFVLYAFPAHPHIHTMANQSSVFNTRFKRWLMPRLAVFPIRRNRGMLDQEAVNLVYELLNRDERVLIFPEGAYGRDGELKPLKDGVGYFALNSGRPLLPVSLSGTGRLKLWSPVRVVIGEPFMPDPPPLWEVRQRVAVVVTGVQQVLGRLGRRSARPRAGVRRRLRTAGGRWWRAGPRVDRPGATPSVEAAQAHGVERGDAEVDGGHAGAQQQEAEEPAPQRP